MGTKFSAHFVFFNCIILTLLYIMRWDISVSNVTDHVARRSRFDRQAEQSFSLRPHAHTPTGFRPQNDYLGVFL